MTLDRKEEFHLQDPEHTVYPELSGFIETTRRLHDLVNDPTTRKENAPIKAQLIRDLAEERLRKQTGSYKVETIEALYEEKNTPTHNVVVTLGEPESGPTTILMVHHDVIDVGKENKVNSGLIPLTDSGGKLKGRTIQDNTIHLAATIESLGKIAIPKKGAVVIVFTDHEENGCRGSHALKKKLADRLNRDQPVALIALESTQDSDRKPVKVGVGHRGKLDAQTEGAINGSAADTFLGFYERLSEAGLIAYSASMDEFGHTVGTSTCGFIDLTQEPDKQLWAKLDFRTNSHTTPSDVLSFLEESPEEELAYSAESARKRTAELLQSGVVSVRIDGRSISIVSSSKLGHPALFNPTEDETALPVLYSLIKLLKDKNRADSIRKVTWGSVKKQNSNPLEASIELEEDLSEEDLSELLHELIVPARESSRDSRNYKLPVKEDSVVKTGAVLGKNDKRLNKALEAVGGEASYLTFMTDIGAQFGELTERKFGQIYTYVLGIGDPARLHKEEEVTHDDIKWLISRLPLFINAVNESLSTPLV